MGSIPQPFTHLGLISAAIELDQALHMQWATHLLLIREGGAATPTNSLALGLARARAVF